MDADRKILTANMQKVRTTGIRAVDDVHNFIWDLRVKGKPCQSIKLRPAHFSIYAFWVSQQIGSEKVYGKDGTVAAPLTCDGVGIECGSDGQFAYILPHYLPMDEKTVEKYREARAVNGAMPEHHSQVK